MKMKVRIEMEVTVPDGTSKADLDEWIRWECKSAFQIAESNPLICTEMIAEWLRWEEVPKAQS
jgi:hypothetical protein